MPDYALKFKRNFPHRLAVGAYQSSTNRSAYIDSPVHDVRTVWVDDVVAVECVTSTTNDDCMTDPVTGDHPVTRRSLTALHH